MLKNGEYGTRAEDFAVGQRVELSPACDLWMMGARFGTVRKIVNGRVCVKMDNPRVRKLQWMAPAYLCARSL